MSIVTMDMSSFEIDRDDEISPEMNCSDWQPQLALQIPASPPPTILITDVDAFLKRMYACQ